MNAKKKATKKSSGPAMYADDEMPFDESQTHRYRGKAVVCETDARGYPTPGNRSPAELVVDASEGFIPLWGPDVTLRWRIPPQTLALFVDPPAAESYLRSLFAEGLLLWDDAPPIRFKEADDAWDFELAVTPNANCRPSGCTLARAFFPDAGRHDLLIYPTLFEQSEAERRETMAHELGHIFGLRHFFASLTETTWPSETFGDHVPFSIMNYGAKSVMTKADQSDLKELYRLVWSGGLTAINGTPIKQVRPFSESRVPHPACTGVGQAVGAQTVMAR